MFVECLLREKYSFRLHKSVRLRKKCENYQRSMLKIKIMVDHKNSTAWYMHCKKITHFFHKNHRV